MIATGLFVIDIYNKKGYYAHAVYYMNDVGKSMMMITYLCDCVNGEESQLSSSRILQLYSRNNLSMIARERTPRHTIKDIASTYERVKNWHIETYVIL